ncbi:DUF2147 domain-containing protein [Sphingopyxis sp. LARHCG72]
MDMRLPGFLIACLALPASVPVAAADGDAAVGLWRNATNSVHILAHHCGASMCGKVVWANEQAIADARRGGTPNLIGLDIFRDFERDKDGNWRGKLFVPDVNKTFSGTAKLLDHDQLRGEGCLLGGLICKEQILTRISETP